MSQDSQSSNTSPSIRWTAEQVLALAPDANSRRVSRRMAGPEKWLTLGSTSGMIWGEFPVKNKPSIEMAIRLADPAFTCSCGSKRSPCDHAMSLLLLWTEMPDSFRQFQPPDWVYARLDSIPLFNLRDLPSPGHTPSNTHSDQPGRRQIALSRGLQELELWLLDLVRNGLADAPHRPKTAWVQVAERLVDAGASSVAREVRRLANIPASRVDWPERLLGRLGLLYLLIQGFERLDSLPTEAQADLRAAVGWLPRPDLSRPDLCQRDHWQVLSNQLIQDHRRRIQRTWLWAENQNRPALIVQRSYNATTFDTRLMSGTVLDASLCYFPGSMPIRAQIERLHERTRPVAPVAGYPSIDQAVAVYSQAISRNPWLGAFPVVLSSATAAPDGTGWLLYDHSGGLPLPPKHPHLWHLRVLTRHADVPVFGEWDGEALHPLSVWLDGRWIELRNWQGAAGT